MKFYEWEDNEEGERLYIAAYPNGNIHISMENDWAGDSETGMHMSCLITRLKGKSIKGLIKFLQEISK